MEDRQRPNSDTRNSSLDAFVTNISSLQSLKQSYIDGSCATSSFQSTMEPPTSPSAINGRVRTNSASSASSVVSSGVLVRIPSDHLVITKEKPRQPVNVNKESSRPSREPSRPGSRAGSTLTSGATTPVIGHFHKPLSEAAIRLNANLLSHNHGADDTSAPSSVFNAEYSMSAGSYTSHPNSSTDAKSAPPNHGVARDFTSIPQSDQLQASHHSRFTVGPPHPHAPLAHASPEPVNAPARDLALRNAQLEGQLEMLALEAEQAIQQRADLQTQLITLRKRLEASSTPLRAADASDSAELKATIDKLSKQTAELVQVIAGKSAEVDQLNEQTRTQQDLNVRLQEALSRLTSDLRDREADLALARSELRERNVAAERSTGDSQAMEERISALQDDVVSISKTRDWFKDQLHAAQQNRNDLQTEVTQLRNLVSSQTDALERLKVETSQLRHQLEDSRVKALSEKQLLMRHLESIEADMFEREAGFEAIENEKGLVEQTWQHKMMQIEKERMALSKMVTESSDFERRLQTVQSELDARNSDLQLVQSQYNEQEKRLVVAQQNLHLSSQELEFTKEKLIEAETSLNKVQRQDRERGNLLQTLKQDKAALQVALTAANEEKAAFSQAVETLKLNTQKVETNFRQMKTELVEKTLLISELEESLEQTKKVKLESAVPIKSEPSTDLLLPAQVMTLTSTNQPPAQVTSLNSTNQLPDRFTTLNSTNQLSAPVTTRNSTHQLGVKSTNHLPDETTNQISAQTAIDVKALTDHLIQLKSALEYSEERVENLHIEKRTLEQQVTSLKSNSAELEHLLQKSHSDKRKLDVQVEELMRRLGQHRTAENQHKLLQSDKNQLQNKLDGLVAELSAMRDVHDSTTAELQAAVDLARRQTAEIQAERDSVRRELKQNEEASQQNANQQQEHLYAQISMLRGQLEATQLQKADLESQISGYHDGVQTAVEEYQRRLNDSNTSLEHTKQKLLEERSETQATINRYRSECQLTERLGLELEREKGKVTALKNQLDKLKQHITTMEAAVGSREAVIQELTADKAARGRIVGQADEERELRLRQLQEDLNSQAERAADLQNQLSGSLEREKRLESRANTLILDNTAVQRELDEKSLALVSTQSELQTLSELGEKQTTNIALLNREYRAARSELDSLRRSASEVAAREPILSDQLNSLHWTARQKTQEADNLQNQLRLAEERMGIECGNLRKSLQETSRELEVVKMEMEAVRKDKFSYQTKSSQLRTALKSLLGQFKAFNSSLPAHVGTSPIEGEDKYKQLLNDTTAPSLRKSKPLESLKSCLVGLNSEISTLQEHMDEHKKAITSNTESWRAVETEVADLEKLIAASREVSKSRSAPAQS